MKRGNKYCRRILLVFTLFAFTLNSHAQLFKKLKEKVQRTAERKLEQKVEKETEEAMDSILNPNSGVSVGKKPVEPNEDNGTNTSDGKYIEGKFDFVAGGEIVFYDDFSMDRKGDFPAEWNTNGSGAIVFIEGSEDRWLKIPDKTLSYPEIEEKLPENFTIEFDLYYAKKSRRPPITFGFSENRNPVRQELRGSLFYFKIDPSKDQVGYSTQIYSGHEKNKAYPVNKMAGKVIRVSMSVNNERIRLYFDQNKMFDLPRGFDTVSLRNNFYLQATEIIPSPEDGFYITNIRIAKTGEDIRSKLMKDGNYTTTGILFSVNSSVVKAESYGVIKQVALALLENPGINLEIVGHTDTDGDAESNLKLSLERAEAIKEVLVKIYKIDSDRLICTGKGEIQPIADNTTAKGKAQNRRVEFLKIN